MKKSSTIFLQVVVVLIGMVALAIMIRFPLTEGRTTNLDLFSIYADPFIIYGYLSSIALSVLIVIAAIYIRVSFNDNADDDPAGFMAVSIVATFISIVVAAAATVFERTLQNESTV